MFCVRTERKRRPIVCFKSGFGDLDATQYFKFSPSSWPVFAGGGLMVHSRSWYARLVGWFFMRRWSLVRVAALKFFVRLWSGLAWKPYSRSHCVFCDYTAADCICSMRFRKVFSGRSLVLFWIR